MNYYFVMDELVVERAPEDPSEHVLAWLLHRGQEELIFQAAKMAYMVNHGVWPRKEAAE